MKNQTTRQTLAEDIKKEIMADLQRQNMMQQMNPASLKAIKWDVLAQIEAEQQAGNQRMQGQQQNRNQWMQGQQQSGQQNNRSNTDQALINSIKQDVLAHINAGFNAYQSGINAYHSGMAAYNQPINPQVHGMYSPAYDPVLIETVKREVIAQMGVEQQPVEAPEAEERAQVTGQPNQRQYSQHFHVDPYLVDMVKQQVMFEMQTQQRPIQQ